ncbi:MAG: hypothetical protein HFI98_06210 [Lachnospiraceae bacterium]|nr:hypothetical protein [Lachnospiraceae bacterium]
MKEKLLKLSKSLLLGCMALDIWFTCSLTSLLFLGEYEHPKKTEKN